MSNPVAESPEQQTDSDKASSRLYHTDPKIWQAAKVAVATGLVREKSLAAYVTRLLASDLRHKKKQLIKLKIKLPDRRRKGE